jgi:hypothetical protein
MEGDIFEMDLNELENLGAEENKKEPSKAEEILEGAIVPEDNKKEDVLNDNEMDTDFLASLESSDEVPPAKEDGKENKSAPEIQGSPSSIYNSLTSALVEEGALSLEEEALENVKSSEDFINVFKEEINKKVKAALEEKLPKQENTEIQQAEANLNQYKQVNEQILTQEGDNGVKLRTALIARDYMNSGMSQEKALKLAERSIDLGEDLDDAREALKSVTAFEESRINHIKEKLNFSKQQEAQKEQQKLEDIKNMITNSEEIIPGVKFNSRTKDKVFDNMTAIEEYTSTGAPINSFLKRMSEDDEFRVKVHYLDVITEGFTKWDKIKRSQKSKAVKELEQAVNQEHLKSVNKTVTPKRNESKLDNLFNALNF